jgi:hypothetical protein
MSTVRTLSEFPLAEPGHDALVIANERGGLVQAIAEQNGNFDRLWIVPALNPWDYNSAWFWSLGARIAQR